MTEPATCPEGVWVLFPMPCDGEQAISVTMLRCTDCHEWWVILDHKDGGHYPAPATQEEAFRQALNNYAPGRG